MTLQHRNRGKIGGKTGGLPSKPTSVLSNRRVGQKQGAEQEARAGVDRGAGSISGGGANLSGGGGAEYWLCWPMIQNRGQDCSRERESPLMQI